MKQRLLIILLTLLTTTTAGAQSQQYYLSLHINDGSDPEQITAIPSTYNYITGKYQCTIPTNITRSGYVLLGWSNERTGSVVYQSGKTITLTSNLDIYAQWVKPKENCTVTFKANGGTGSMDAVTQAGGTEFVIPSCGFSYGSYVCAGWATSEVGRVVYHPGDKITLADDLTLYAKWSNPQTEFTLNGLKYKYNIQTSPTVSLIDYDGSMPMGDLVIPGSVTYGGTEYTVTTIGDYAFDQCASLTAVSIPSSVTSFGSYAFSNTGLTSVTLTEGLKTIGDYAFNQCASLTSVSIPASVTFFGSYAFSNTGLTSVTLTEGLMTIGDYAFNQCASLTAVSIPSSVTFFGYYAFSNTGLTSVTLTEGLETIGDYAFNKCSGLTSASIPASVTSIGSGAFSNTGLTSVTLTEGLETIGNYAFNKCSGLTSVTIPASVTTIGNSAFEGCTGLTSVTTPSSVETIGSYAFNKCTSLTSVTIFAPSLTKYETYAFASNASGRKIYVPSGSVDTYKAGWSGDASAIEPLHYIIDEGKDVSILSNGTGKNVALKRSFTKGKKQTVCLPYAPAELLNYGKVWEFTGINGDKAVMTEITNKASLQANTPYIFEASNDLLNITFPGVDISIGSDPKTEAGTAGFTFHGTYAEKIWEATSDEVVKGTIYGFMMKDNDGQTVGQFVKARRRTVLRPFSCYLEYNGDLSGIQSSAARGEAQEPLPEVIDIVWLAAGDTGTATGIKEVKSEKYGVEGWFSLDGRRLSGKPSQKGLYIHNGTKVVIK